MSNGTSGLMGLVVQVERLVAEGGIQWENIYKDIAQSDPEVGVFYTFSQARTLFQRHHNDADTSRMDLETARRYKIYMPGTAATVLSWASCTLVFTYHAITFSSTITIQNSAGGTVNIDIVRSSDGQVMQKYSRTGNGDVTITGYDDTETYYAVAYESDAKLARSANFNFGD